MSRDECSGYASDPIGCIQVGRSLSWAGFCCGVCWRSNRETPACTRRWNRGSRAVYSLAESDCGACSLKTVGFAKETAAPSESEVSGRKRVMIIALAGFLVVGFYGRVHGLYRFCVVVTYRLLLPTRSGPRPTVRSIVARILK